MVRSAPFLARVPGGQVPRGQRSYWLTKTAPPPSRRASLPSLGGTLPCVLVRSHRADTDRQAWAFVLRCPNRIARKERRSSPRFLGDPCAHALLFDPGGAPTPGQYGVGAIAFRLVNSVGSTSSLSGLYDTACTPPVYASQPESPLDHATLGSGGRPILTGQDFHLGVAVEGFRLSLSCGSLPPPPGFAWRNNQLICSD